MANIAKIRLAPGESGYYDDKSNISLSWNRPEANVPEGTDCSGLIRSVKAKRLIVVEGSLGQNKSFKQFLQEAKEKKKVLPKPIKPINPAIKTITEIINTQEKQITQIEETIENIPIKEKTNETTADNDSGQNLSPINDAKTPLTITPKSIKSLTVGSTKELTANYSITEAISNDKNIAIATFDSNIITVKA